MKRVCHITTVHKAEDIRIFLKECSSLAAYGYEVHLIAPGQEDYEKNGVKIHALRAKASNRLQRMSQRVQAVKKIVSGIQPELVHLHDPELLRLALRFKHKGMKVVYDAHEDVPRQILSKYYIHTSFRTITAFAVEHFENYVAQRLDLIVGATPTITERFGKLGIPVVNVNNFPLHSEFRAVDFDPKLKEAAVCYAGGLSAIRGIREMVSLAKLLPDVKFLMAGTFADDVAVKVVEEAEQLPNFEFLGQLDRKGVVALYTRSMAGLALLHPEPNHINSLPIKLFEYMSAGVPAVASNFPLWKRIVEENECGYCIDPFELEEIARHIRHLIDHPDEAKKLGQQGKTAISEHYNWEAEASKLRDAYEAMGAS